jgi:hypothetical protein
VGPLGDGRDPERPGRDQALTTVDADCPANSQIAQRAPLISHSATPTRDEPLEHHIGVVPSPARPDSAVLGKMGNCDGPVLQIPLLVRYCPETWMR